jgi:hypothetical protein
LPSRKAYFRATDVVLGVDRRTAGAAAGEGGRDVLLYQLVPRSFVRFLGLGRVSGLTFGGERDPVSCRIEQVRAFASPITSPEEAALPRVQSMLSLSDVRFAEILAAADITDAAAEEANATFAPDAKTYEAIYRRVLERWDYRCAVTGRRFPQATGTHSELRLVAIRPREQGGPLHVRNYLPMVEEAARAWQRGDISVTDGLEFVAVQDRLSPDLLEKMRPDGRLLVPDGAALGPDPEHLAFHRIRVFGS